MSDERYVLNCPHCGPVVGYAADDEPEDTAPSEADSVIEEEVFESPAGPVTRARCPRCGRWVEADREAPD